MAFIAWSTKRQLFYVVIVLAFIGISVLVISYPSLNKAPSCVDNKQNGTETGVDCGGTCAKACTSQVDQLSVLWARSFKVITGRYNAVAYVVNHNKSTGVQAITYRFRFADAKNVYIGKRDGTTFIPPGGNFAIFEPAIDIGNSIPVYTTFEFTQAPLWLQVPQDKIDQLKILVSNIQLTGEDASPKLSATIKNTSLFTIPNMGVVAILYDATGNALSASRTFLNQLAPLASSDINFTWPETFSLPVVAKEIIPMYDIFSVKLK